MDRYGLVVPSVFPFTVNKPVEEKFDKQRLIFIFILEGAGALDLNFC